MACKQKCKLLMLFILLSMTGSSLVFGMGKKSEESIKSSNPKKTIQSTIDLKVTLTTDKTICQPGDEIKLQIELINQSNKPMHIIMPSAFVGERIQCQREQGALVPFRIGHISYSVKTGVYLGRTYLLQPEEKYIAKLDAYIDKKYNMVLALHTDIPTSTGKEIEGYKKRLGLPDDYPNKFITTGRTYPLKQSGNYNISYVYETKAFDTKWRFSQGKTEEEKSVKHLWLGKSQSNAIKMQVK